MSCDSAAVKRIGVEPSDPLAQHIIIKTFLLQRNPWLYRLFEICLDLRYREILTRLTEALHAAVET